MRVTLPLRCLSPIVLAFSLVLTSCGDGSTTAGTGGSGVGGTGITTISGNVAQVTAQATPRDRGRHRRLLASVAQFLGRPAQAQSVGVGNIQVFGGGQITTTDGAGNFALQGVTPSQNFVLNFTLPDDRTFALPIGAVPEGSRVVVVNVRLESDQRVAFADDVRVEEDDDGPGDDAGAGGRADDGIAPDDDNSTDDRNDADDGNSSDSGNDADSTDDGNSADDV